MYYYDPERPNEIHIKDLIGRRDWSQMFSQIISERDGSRGRLLVKVTLIMMNLKTLFIPKGFHDLRVKKNPKTLSLVYC